MRVVFAPDKFAGTLTAVEAAAAMARGWARRSPDDELVQVPMSDGGPGFVDVLHAALGGDLHAVTVPARTASPTPATVLRVGDTAYVESAQAVRPAPDRAARTATRSGPTRAGSASCSTRRSATGATRIVVGLGGSGTNDGGAGMLAALGATADSGTPRRRTCGPRPTSPASTSPLSGSGSQGIDLVMASDVDNPLFGINGATKIYGPQKGLPDERLVVVDGWLQRFAELTDRKLAAQKGAGAAGGLGFALMLLGGHAHAGRDAGRRGGRASRAAWRPPTWSSPGRAPSTSPPAPARSPTASPRWPRAGAGAVHRPGRAGAHRVAGDAGAGRGVGVLGGRPGGGGAGPRGTRRRPGRARRAHRPHLVAVTDDLERNGPGHDGE